MARTQSEKYPEIRQNILSRSAAVFARKGYARATIVDLAQACETSRGALYHYFDSKEAILNEILVAHLDMMFTELLAAASSSADPEQRFRNTIHRMVMVNAGSRNEQIVLLNDLQYLDAPQRSVIVKKQNDIVAVFSDMMMALDGGRRISARNLKAYAMMYLGMINYTYLWYDPAGPVGPEEYAEMVANTCVAGILRDGSAP